MEQSDFFWPLRIACKECGHVWLGYCEGVPRVCECPRCRKMAGNPFAGFPIVAKMKEANNEI